MSTSPHPSYYETSDFYLAVVLYALGANLESVERSDRTRSTFVFELTTGIQSTIEAYWKRGLSVEPQCLFSAIKFLKSRIYN
jgi:hypothetical protein